MNKKRIASLVLVLMLLALVTSAVSAHAAYAQNLRFQVTRAVVNVWINTDGTMSIDYQYDFANQPGADKIDFIDVIMPQNSTWSANNANAEVNGAAITDVQKSDFEDNAIAFGLGANAIQPGRTGTFHMRVDKVSKVIYPYDNGDKQDYASFNFRPNTFGSQFVSGKTDYTVILRLPPGLTSEEPIYYTPNGWPGDDTPSSAYDQENRVTYTWQTPNGSLSDEYIFGGAFPAKLVPAGAIVKSTGPSLTVNTSFLPCLCFGLFFAGIVGVSIYSATVGAKKRKLAYLPPRIAIEGHGIKRGLTSVEAGILMEQPMDKIMTMILFAVIKKGAAKVVTRDPLKLELTAPLPEGLNQYEIDFLHAFEAENALTRRKALQDMMVALVKTVSEKMKGFSRKETIAYYDDIMKRAWEQVEAADTPEVKSQKLDEGLEWTMLDKDFGGHTQTVFGPRPVILPGWWGSYDPTFHGGSSPRPASAGNIGTGSGQTTINLPHLPGSDFAASVTNGVQSFASGVIGDLTAFTGGVTQHTNPPPPPSTPSRSGGGGGGGGRSCACACACAGCACACAGGGR